MLVSFLHDFANIVIALALLRLLATFLLSRDPDSALGKAIAYIH